MRYRRLLSLLLIAPLSACGGAELRRDYHEATGKFRLELGPLDVSTFTNLYLATEFSEASLPPPDRTRVTATFRYKDFNRVDFFADGERLSFPRIAFHSHTVSIPLPEFETIGQARRVAVSFDGRGLHELDPEDVDLLNRFTNDLLHFYERTRIQGRPKGVSGGGVEGGADLRSEGATR